MNAKKKTEKDNKTNILKLLLDIKSTTSNLARDYDEGRLPDIGDLKKLTKLTTSYGKVLKKSKHIFLNM